MPKRPIPSDQAEKEEAKKARTRSAPKGDGVRLGGKISVAAAAASTSSAGRVSAAASGVAAAVLPPPQNDEPTQSSSSLGPSGNSFLKSLRSMSNSMTSNGETKKSTVDAATQPNKKTLVYPISNGSATPSSKAEDPVVPFPYLPVEGESKMKRWAPLLLLFLFPLNMAAVVYFASQQSWHNMIQLKRDLEMSKLRDDLALRQNEVDVQKNQMNALEQAREARQKILVNDKEVFNGLFGPQVGGGSVDDVITIKDRNEWLEKLKVLEMDVQLALDEFNNELLKFGIEIEH